MYALVDCNNFYASCERVFDPKLRGRPVVVLSNNDGCVIARSQEAKDIGIPMGAPAFKYKYLFQRFNVAIFSANFVLYGDISGRIMSILRSEVPDIEIYSIDEAFLKFKFTKGLDLEQLGSQIRERVVRSTGVPISIGIAPTKTLAKICSHEAKKKTSNGVFDWNKVSDKDGLLKKTPVRDIWGIGYRNSYRLNELGVYNALQLKQSNESWIRKTFSVTMLRTVTEIKEIPCFTLESNHEPKKNIMSSRSFGRPVEKLEELQEAVASYTTRACEKLREQRSAAAHIYVSIKTNMHRKDLPQYCQHRIKTLDAPSFYNPDFINKAFEGLSEIYVKGYKYKKATVMLLGIVPQKDVQLNLFDQDRKFKQKIEIMKTFDRVNNRYGREVISYAATGLKRRWRGKKEKCSLRYTTSWNELLTIRI